MTETVNWNIQIARDVSIEFWELIYILSGKSAIKSAPEEDLFPQGEMDFWWWNDLNLPSRGKRFFELSMINWGLRNDKIGLNIIQTKPNLPSAQSLRLYCKDIWSDRLRFQKISANPDVILGGSV